MPVNSTFNEIHFRSQIFYRKATDSGGFERITSCFGKAFFINIARVTVENMDETVNNIAAM